MAESKLNRPLSFFLGFAEYGFGIEQAFFCATYLFMGLAAFSMGLWPVGLAAIALAIAPGKATANELINGSKHISHATRRGK